MVLNLTASCTSLTHIFSSNVNKPQFRAEKAPDFMCIQSHNFHSSAKSQSQSETCYASTTLISDQTEGRVVQGGCGSGCWVGPTRGVALWLRGRWDGVLSAQPPGGEEEERGQISIPVLLSPLRYPTLPKQQRWICTQFRIRFHHLWEFKVSP